MARISERGLEVFVPGRLVSVANTREHWAARATRTRTQREAVALAVWAALREPPRDARMTVWRITAQPATPKTITFVARVARVMDEDNLAAALKAYRDGLQDCGLIDSDAPSSGHTFRYAQQTGRPYGVTIRIAVRGAGDAPMTIESGGS